MCLLSENRNPLTAENDIVCYKLMVQADNGEFETPYQYSRVDYDIIDGKRNLVAEGSEDIRHFMKCGKYEINGGFIHCYTDYNAATFNADFFPYLGRYACFVKARVFKCIIPKGTTYYEGVVSDICAKEIKFIEELYSRTIINNLKEYTNDTENS